MVKDYMQTFHFKEKKKFEKKLFQRTASLKPFVTNKNKFKSKSNLKTEPSE